MFIDVKGEEGGKILREVGGGKLKSYFESELKEERKVGIGYVENCWNYRSNLR